MHRQGRAVHDTHQVRLLARGKETIHGDGVAGDREYGSSAGLIQFLTVLDGLMTRHSGVVTIATTNDPEAIDAAVNRAARFDQVVDVPLPSEEARGAILDLYLSRTDHRADLADLGRASDGLSGADLCEVVRSSLLDSHDSIVEHADLISATERLGRSKGLTPG